jgi:hypothetical protein
MPFHHGLFEASGCIVEAKHAHSFRREKNVDIVIQGDHSKNLKQ